MITSCLECRRRKLKCNKSTPCTNCLKFNRECVYLGPKLDEASQLRLTEIKEKVGSLERQLERDVAKATSKAAAQQRILADDVDDNSDEEGDLEITPMVALDLAYEDDPDGTDDIIDLGIQVGRMRITERIGGLSRPRLSEEIQTGLSTAAQPPTSHPGQRLPLGGENNPENAESEAPIPEFLRPGATYIPPSSGFFFGQIGQAPAFIQLLPQRHVADRLLERYWVAAHPITTCVHKPTFEKQYASFWDHVTYNYEPPPPLQSLVFAAWFTAAVGLEDDVAMQHYGYTKQQLVDLMKIGTESALAKANFLRTTRVDTMQAFIMYLIPLCRAEVSRAHSVLLGAAVRMAECMGLHRDGQAYGLNPLETHVRRLLWHQLCFLDVRTCEAQGPKPAIRREDYDTKLPLNCEEDQLSSQTEVIPEPADSWTSALLPLIRFEINEMMRIIWADRRKLEAKKTTLTAVLTKIENFRKRMLEKYDHLIDDRVPIQHYAKLVMHLLMYRLHAMVLHPYHANTATPLPPRLSNVLIQAGLMIIELSIQLETLPEFKDWWWYLGAYSQYQIALLLATEMFYRPDNKDAARIWACLDYVFRLDPSMPHEQKGRLILGEIVRKREVYDSMRKVRAPTTMAKAVPDKQAVKTETPPQTSFNIRNIPPSAPQQEQYAAHPTQSMYVGERGVKGEQNRTGMTGRMPPPPSGMSMAQQSQLPPPAPQPAMVFAGVSNGEVLWSLPPGYNASSPSSSSDGGGQNQQRMSVATGGVMESMDWYGDPATLNQIFPPDPLTGDFNFSTFAQPNLGGRWPPV